MDLADFSKYLTNSGGRQKKLLCQNCLKMVSRKCIFGSQKSLSQGWGWGGGLGLEAGVTYVTFEDFPYITIVRFDGKYGNDRFLKTIATSSCFC